ncbi:MAG: hypothetical protein ACRDFW_05310 [bacterium]
MRPIFWKRLLGFVSLVIAAPNCGDLPSSASSLAGFSVLLEHSSGRTVSLSDTLIFNSLYDMMALHAIVVDRLGLPVPAAVVKWESLSPDIVSVDSSGRVVARSNGITAIRLAARGAVREQQVRVGQIAATLRVGIAAPMIAAGDEVQLTGILTDSNDFTLERPQIRWTSLYDSVASIDSSGVLRGHHAGVTSVKGHAGALVDSAIITVRSRPLLSWVRERYVGNPVIQAVLDNPAESLSQYVPAPIRLPNGDIWVYVKSDHSHAIWAYNRLTVDASSLSKVALSLRAPPERGTPPTRLTHRRL